MAPVLTPGRIRAARIIAVVADAIQFGLTPLLFVPATLVIVDAVLDVAVGITMVVLLGWHLVFLPGFVVEMVPMVDLFPTWTLAVLFVTRGGAPTPDGASVPPISVSPPPGKITDIEAK